MAAPTGATAQQQLPGTPFGGDAERGLGQEWRSLHQAQARTQVASPATGQGGAQSSAAMHQAW